MHISKSLNLHDWLKDQVCNQDYRLLNATITRVGSAGSVGLPACVTGLTGPLFEIRAF